ncbi:uncharacterized protein LOC133922851 isoform X2 [Phragmites australis]|uniref:uncharacterized protein LOC133922851 isoform X2 n=1 Tax=Phragmites australis TaxID=29695 RepID=UPI002D77871B|nr:uncharacterized protein LOC133922851 isoform X2 [Phragmites australis]
MCSTSGGSSDDGAGGGNTPRGNGNQDVIDAPHSRSCRQSNLSTARRSRVARNPCCGEACIRLGDVAPGSSPKKRKGATEEGQHGTSKKTKISASASPTSRDSNRTSSSALSPKNSAKEQRSEYGMTVNVRTSSNKRKLMGVKSYIALFKPSRKAEATDAVSAKQSSIPTTTKKVKESPFQKLQRLPDGCHPDFDNDHLCSINKLREFWHKSQGAVFIDDKERVMKTILFVLTVLPDVCQPFLLVTTASLALWKAEFNRFAPCINVVVYDGEKDARKLIKKLEFDENGSHVMLHILLAHPDSILEDNLFEYKNLLAFLNSEEEDNGDYADADADALVLLRARFTRHVAYERKTVSSNFMEYWVPAYLSQVQLKLYCSILLANSNVLQSQMATDGVGPLRDIILCLWKCCNHPCLVDELLQHSLVNIGDVIESIHDRTRVSGKLLLLEKMLKEIRSKRLRVIVLFQSNRAGGGSMGEILEELVRHTFGSESYERVQNCSAFSKKQAAMNMFNDMMKGRFIFLIENSACRPSIKLSSIDAIIIYSSDQNPLNDLKALRKIKIESQLKHVCIFRLYTPFTVEGNGLVLAKQGMVIDSNSQDLMLTLSHCLLSWGVSFLFSRVDELQQDNCASKSYERDIVFMDKVISEFLTELSTNVEDSAKVNSATISKACMSGGFYSRNITLIGDMEGVSSLDGDPPTLWLNLLDGKSPCRRYMSEPQVSLRNVQNMEKPIEVPAEETNEARRKCVKTGEIVGPSSKFSSDVSNNDLFPEISTSSSADLQPLGATGQKAGVENPSTPKSLHVKLKRELSKLSKVLELPDNVRFLAEQFLEYLLKNHLVMWEPQGMLHAFNMALCWRAASLLKYTELDRRKSLALAADCLNYEYNEELTELFFEKLGTVKEKIVHKPGGRSKKVENDRFSSQESSSANLGSDHLFPKQAMDLHGNFTNGTPQESSSAAEQMVSDGQELVSAPEAAREWHLSSEELPNMSVKKRIELFNNVFSLRQKNIHEKQQLEILEFRTQRENQVIKLKNVCGLVVQHIRTNDINEETRNDQIKLVIQWFTMLVYAFLEHMKLQLDKLEALQSSTWFEERMMKEKLKQEVISGQLDHSFDICIALPDSNFVIEEFIHFKKQGDGHHVDEILVSGCDQLLDDKLIMEITLARNSVPSEAFSTRAVRNEHAETLVGSGGGAALESVDLPENSIHCSSDGIDLQRVCCSSAPASHDSISQESSSKDFGSIEHAKSDNITNPSMLLRAATSLVLEINADNQGTVAADPVHLESPILASPQSLRTLSLSREVGTEANLSNLSSQQTVGTLQHPHAEVEPTDTLHIMAAQDLQTEMQKSSSTLDVPPHRKYPDDSSQMSHELDTTTGLLQEGTISYHLGDVRMGVKAKNAAADSLNSGKQSYIAPDNPGFTQDAREVETQTDQSSMPAQQSTSPPAQQRLATSGYPPAEAEPSSNLGMEATQNLQPEIQPSSSMLDADSSQTGHQPETTPGLSKGGFSYHHLVDATLRAVESNNNTICAHQAHLESPTVAASQSSPMLPFSSEVETRTNLSCMSSQQSSRPYSATNLSEDGETEYPPCTTHNVAALTLPREVETENSQAIMPMQQSTSPHVWHPTEGAKPAGILGMMAADDSQPSTLMLDQTAEAEQAGTLGAAAAAAQDLHPETQLATRTQDAPYERTDVSGMPVPQNTALQQSLQPSWDTLAGVEPADVSGMVVAHDLQSEMQPSSSMQDQPVEAERAGTWSTMATQDLQHEMQPSTSMQHIPPGRAHPDERIQIGLQPNTTPGPEQFTQLFPVASVAFNHLICSSEPLKNELERLKHCTNLLSKNHEQKKLVLQAEYKQEMEKVVKKYESLLQKEDSTFLRMTSELADIYRKVFVQQSLAENFREKFMKSSAAQERSASPAIGQAPQSSQQALAWTSVAQTTTSPVASSLATRPPVLTSFHSTGPFLQPSQVARPSASEAIQLQSIVPRNLYRATSPLSSIPLQNGSYRVVGAQSRGPAPHLQHLRMPPLYAMVHRDRQQLPVISPGITSLRQSAPVTLESFASTSPLAGVVIPSMASSSVHQTMTPASNSHPAPPASSLLPAGSLPDFMANFVQSLSTNPVLMATQQSSNQSPAFHNMLGPVNAAAAAGGIWHAGAHIAGVNGLVPESALETLLFQQRWRAASMASGSVHQTMAPASNSHAALSASSLLSVPLPASGAASTGAGRGGSGEVVCLSDDEE